MTAVPFADPGPLLEALYARHHRPERVSPDPLELAHGWERPEDAEVAAFLSASVAYGRVAQILKSGRRILDALGPSPAQTLRDASPRELDERLGDIKHRFNDGRDFALFASLMGQVLREFGSLGALFESVQSPPPGEPAEPDLSWALDRFVARLAQGDAAPFFPEGEVPLDASFHYLLPRPERGSACKRLFMFLRWMVRPADGVDLGLWNGFASPARLIIPVDTHVLRFSQHLGLTTRNDASLRTAREITRALKRYAPDDPVRFDFSLARLGILAECPSRERLELCDACELAPACRRRASMLEE
jgi:uncharacterized protein (TIGR02757 family)